MSPINNEFGNQNIKLSPQAVDLERCVLGGIMLDNGAMQKVLSTLQDPSMFYDVRHQYENFDVMLELQEKYIPIDLMIIASQLREKEQLEKVGGAFYLVELTNSVVSAANIEYHSRIIFQKYIKRQVIKASQQILNDAYDETVDCFDLLIDTMHILTAKIADKNSKFCKIKTMLEISDLWNERLEKAKERGKLGIDVFGLQKARRYARWL